jgi:hypothetical protein
MVGHFLEPFHTSSGKLQQNHHGSSRFLDHSATSCDWEGDNLMEGRFSEWERILIRAAALIMLVIAIVKAIAAELGR